VRPQCARLEYAGTLDAINAAEPDAIDRSAREELSHALLDLRERIDNALRAIDGQ
jgi:hypothetical protein